MILSLEIARIRGSVNADDSAVTTDPIGANYLGRDINLLTS
jgi:hypothetical protein